MSEDHVAVLERFQNEQLCIDQMFHVAASITAERGSNLVEHLENSSGDHDAAAQLGLSIADLEELEEYEWEELARALFDRGKLGYLVQYGTPVPYWRNAGTDLETCGYSWGYSRHRWFYGDTLGECHEQAFAWRDKFWAEEKVKSLAGAAE